MSTSTWGGPEAYPNESYPSSLLRHLLHHMMTQFAAQGACIALFDESIEQLRVQAHVRLRSAALGASSAAALNASGRRMTIHLENDTTSPFARQSTPVLEALDDVLPRQGDLFAIGTAYPIGQDLIGHTWLKG